MIVIPYSDLKENLVFVSDYYDIPLNGLCKYNGQLVKFHKIPCKYDVYEIIPLSYKQKIFEKINQWLFEICVGTHWSYKNGKTVGSFNGFTPMTKLYYWFKKY